MAYLLGVIGVFALFSLVLAIREALAMVRLSPGSKGLGKLFWVGWLRFGTIEGHLSEAAKPHMQIYKRTIIAFVVLIALGLALSGYVSSVTAGK